jgi:hypothetical protein
MTGVFTGRAAALGIAALLAVAGLRSAHACACCGETGERDERTVSVSGYVRDEMAKLNFGQAAAFRSTAGWPEGDVQGVTDPSGDAYDLSAAHEKGRLVLTLKDRSTGKTGRILFTPPRRYTHFLADTREKEEVSEPGALYHEWRFQGTAGLEGIFAAASKHGAARLILHGRGNHCVSAETFHAWTLSVGGGGVKFTLLGRFPSATNTAAGEGLSAPKP